jgi:hypothetical protein
MGDEMNAAQQRIRQARHDREARVTMVRQMITTYGQEATEDRLRGYLEVVAEIPVPSLARAIKSAMRNARDYPPGPGEIVAAWDWQAAHPAPSAERIDPGRRIGPGEMRAQLGSGIDRFEQRVRDPEMLESCALARRIRNEEKVTPAGIAKSRVLSYVAAAIRLGYRWPITADHREILDGWMQEHAMAGGDVDWWTEELENPRATR